MLKTILKKFHYLISTAFLILLIVNGIIAHYCVGVNSGILTIIIIATGLVVVKFIFNRTKLVNMTIIRLIIYFYLYYYVPLLIISHQGIHTRKRML